MRTFIWAWNVVFSLCYVSSKMHWMIYIFLNVNDMFIYIKRKSINVHKYFITVYDDRKKGCMLTMLWKLWNVMMSMCYNILVTWAQHTLAKAIMMTLDQSGMHEGSRCNHTTIWASYTYGYSICSESPKGCLPWAIK
jgi:hypothetical protein